MPTAGLDPGATRAPTHDASACAGLRQTLLRLASEQFPIEHSPFQPLARRLGGSLREVLTHCQALVAEGATPGLQVRWGPMLQRCTRRLAVGGAAWPLQARDAASWCLLLPGLVSWHVVESASSPGLMQPLAAGWLDLIALEPEELERQASLLQAATPGVAWLADAGQPAVAAPAARPGAAPAGCACRRDGGPCVDRELARLCEFGLPTVAHPYHALAQQLGRSEREVLSALRRWRESGRLAALGLAPCAGASHTLLHMAALDLQGQPPELAATLAVRPGIAGAAGTLATMLPHPTAPLPDSAQAVEPARPALTLLTLNLAPHATAAMVEQLLHAAGLSPWVRAVLKVHRWQLRAAPLLFNAGAGPAARTAAQSQRAVREFSRHGAAAGVHNPGADIAP